MLKMQKQSKYNFTPTHLALLEQFENLFSRPNLCTNNYLYKQMNQNFEIPLNVIFQERRIAQITNNEDTLREALQMSSLVQLIDNRTLRVHEFPTLKFNNKFRETVQDLAKNLKILNRKVLVFERRQENEIHLSLLEKIPLKELQQIALNFNKNWEFKSADLHADIKAGVSRIRKLKQQNKRNFRGQKYSLDIPPGIFIRRAVETSDEQEEVTKKQETKTKKEQEKQKQKQRKYRQKPIINEEQFPTLS